MNLLDLRARPPIHELSLEEVEKLIHQVRMNRVIPVKKSKASSSKTTTSGGSDLTKLLKLAENLDPEVLKQMLEG